MPDFDYEQFEKRQAEWEASQTDDTRKRDVDDVDW
jgi:hypothetical protein